MRRYVFDEYTCRDTFNEILFVNFSMKIVYSLSLLRSIEIPFFVYLFRNYSPFYAVSFMSLFDFLSFSSPSLSLPLSTNCFTFRTQFTLYLANVVVRRNVETLRFMEYARAGYDYAQFDVRTTYLTSPPGKLEGKEREE